MSFVRRFAYVVAAVFGVVFILAIASEVISRFDQRCYAISDDEAHRIALEAVKSYAEQSGPRMFSREFVPARLTAEVYRRLDSGRWSQWSYVQVRVMDRQLRRSVVSVAIFSDCSIQWIAPSDPVPGEDWR